MKRRRREDSDNEDDKSSDESSSSIRRHSKNSDKHKKSHKRKHKHKHRKKDRRRRHRDEYESDSSHRKKDRKRRHDSTSRPRKSEKKKPRDTAELTDNDILAQAICGLLEERPSFCGELPIMLIRLVGGTTFNLQQMTDEIAANGLERVFESLAVYGVQKNESNNDLWMFIPPAGASSRDELVLLRVIRSILDEIGVNMSAVQQYEKEELASDTKQQLKTEEDERIETIKTSIKTSTAKLLNDFKDVDPNLGKQLVEICKTILTGESLCIDGLPNAKLKNSLGTIFEQCGLEKTEMENDDDSDDDEDAEEEILMGYGLPENHNGEVKLKLASFIETCDRPPIQKQTRRVLGPQRPPNDLGDDDDEGPVPLGVAYKGPALQARMQQLQQEAAEQVSAEGEREEWMLVPGKHDFLSSIKSGQSIKSRGFKNEKAPEEVEEEINPSIQKEMDSIMEAHKAARGPSLFTQHREKKQQEKQEASGKEADWKWSRDNDLDAGRRVDKDALKLMLGGAATNLQTKFQGGFNR
jgi:hypothetical protein